MKVFPHTSVELSREPLTEITDHRLLTQRTSSPHYTPESHTDYSRESMKHAMKCRQHYTTMCRPHDKSDSSTSAAGGRWSTVKSSTEEHKPSNRTHLIVSVDFGRPDPPTQEGGISI